MVVNILEPIYRINILKELFRISSGDSEEEVFNYCVASI